MSARNKDKETFIQAVAGAALDRFEDAIAALGLSGGKNQGREYVTRNPCRSDEHAGSLSINRDTGAGGDFALDGWRWGDLVGCAAKVWGLRQYDAALRLNDAAGFGVPVPDQAQDARQLAGQAKGHGAAAPARLRPESAGKRRAEDVPADVCVMPAPDDAPAPPEAHPKHGKPSASWRYLDASGRLCFLHTRFEPRAVGERKQFAPLSLWRQPSGALVWRWKAAPAPRPIFGADLLAARPDALVWIVEGEKARDAAAAMLPDAVVVCWAGGAQAVLLSDWSPLAGRDVILWPDRDAPGAGCMEKLAARLLEAGAASVRSLDLDAFAKAGADLPEGGDAADLAAMGWDASRLASVLDATPALLRSTAPKAQAIKGEEAATDSDLLAAAAEMPQGEPVASPRFQLRPSGLWLCEQDRSPIRISAPVEVVCRVRDPIGRGWGRLLRFNNPDGAEVREIIADRAFKGEGVEVLDRLLDSGFWLSARPAHRRAFLEYLNDNATRERARVTNRTGWHDTDAAPVFVLPDRAYGAEASGESWIHATEPGASATFKARGTLESWRQHVAALCVGNSRLAFAAVLPFAATLLKLTDLKSGGFMLRGKSSDGKTIAQQVAVSVFGGPADLQTCRATDNALEAVALRYCDTALVLDEFGQVDAKLAGEMVYMLGNGAGKSRSRTDATLREPPRWRLLYLVSGEVSLETHMQEAGKRSRAGQEIRLLEIPADGGRGLGIFEDLHGSPDGASFAKRLEEATAQHHGAALRAWLETLTRDLSAILADVRAGMEAFRAGYVRAEASGQARRAADRFALLAAVGEIVGERGITGWPAGEAMGAVGRCFNAWLTDRGGDGRREDQQIIEELRAFILRYGESAFSDWDHNSATENRAPVKSDRVGWRRRIKGEGGEAERMDYFIYPALLKDRILKGLNAKDAIKLLADRGIFASNKSDSNHYGQVRKRLPDGANAWMCHVQSSFLEG